MSFEMNSRTINGNGEKLKEFTFEVSLARFNSCPRKNLPDIKGRLIKVLGPGNYLFKVGPETTDLIEIVEGAGEKKRSVGDVEWLQYNHWNRADHHRFWSIKFQHMLDDVFFPIDKV